MKENVKRYFYPAVFGYEDGQKISVVFPNLDAATSGNNDEDAFLSARELLRCVIGGLEEDGEQLPPPSRLMDVELGPNERTVLVDVFMLPERQRGKA